MSSVEDISIVEIAPIALPRRSNFQSVVMNILSVYVLYGISMIIGLAVAPILLRGLGDGSYGLMSSSVATWQYLALLSLGTNTIVLRHIPKVAAAREAGEPERTISTFLAFNLLIALIGGLLVLGVSPRAERFFKVPPELTDIASVSVMLLGFFSVNNSCAAYLGMVLAGSKKLFVNNALAALQGIFIALASVGLVAMGMGLRAVALMMLVLGIVFTLVRFLHVRSLYPGISLRRFDAHAFRVLLGPSLAVLVLGIASTTVYQSGSIIVGASVGVGAVAVYAVTRKLLDSTMGVLIQFSEVMIPYIAEAQVLEEEKGTRLYNRRLLKITTLISAMALFGLLVYGQWLISLWLGPGRFIGRDIWWMLCVWMFLHAITQPGALVVIAVGKQNLLTVIVVLEAMVSMAVGLLLVGKYGVLGVTIGGLVGAIMTVGWFVHWYAAKVTGDTLGRVAKYAFVPGLFSVLPAVVWQAGLNLILVPTTAERVLFGISTSAILLLWGGWQFGLSRAERERLVQTLKTRSVGKRAG